MKGVVLDCPKRMLKQIKRYYVRHVRKYDVIATCHLKPFKIPVVLFK